MRNVLGKGWANVFAADIGENRSATVEFQTPQEVNGFTVKLVRIDPNDNLHAGHRRKPLVVRLATK
ncbi:MAG: hypothetical protein ACO1SV_24640 [Fimbriimonas sp.]